MLLSTLSVWFQVCSSLASLFLLSASTLSLGASGAVFGLFTVAVWPSALLLFSADVLLADFSPRSHPAAMNTSYVMMERLGAGLVAAELAGLFVAVACGGGGLRQLRLGAPHHVTAETPGREREATQRVSGAPVEAGSTDGPEIRSNTARRLLFLIAQPAAPKLRLLAIPSLFHLSLCSVCCPTWSARGKPRWSRLSKLSRRRQGGGGDFGGRHHRRQPRGAPRVRASGG